MARPALTLKMKIVGEALRPRMPAMRGIRTVGAQNAKDWMIRSKIL